MTAIIQHADEVFVPIAEFPAYFIGTKGTVKTHDGAIRNPYKNNGYAMLSFPANGRNYNRLIHRLVAIAFIPNPENKPHINHKNGNKVDNRVENLEWVTPQENSAHYWSELCQDLPTKELLERELPKNGLPKNLTRADIEHIRKVVTRSNVGLDVMAELFGVSPLTIYRIKIGKIQ